MTQFDDFTASLRDGMNDATRDVVAHRDLTQRLIDTASDPASAGGFRTARGSLRSSRFLASWALPAAAAVTMLLTAGAVAVAHQYASGDPVTSGDGIVAPGTSTSATVPDLPPDPTSNARSASPEPHPSRTQATPTTPSANQPRAHTVAPHASPRPTSAARSPHDDGDSSAPTTADTSAPTQESSPPSCSTPDTGEYQPTSLQDFEQHLIGTWLVCAEPSVFGTDDAGLQIRSDGTWAKLTRNSAGQLVAGMSSGQKGDWQAIDDTDENDGRPTFQLNLHIDGSGTVIALAHISTGVDRVALDNNGVYEASYVPTSEDVH